MNQELQKAEHALLSFLHDRPAGATMAEILNHFRNAQQAIGEAELRAAVWTLRAEGVADFDGEKLKEAQPA